MKICKICGIKKCKAYGRMVQGKKPIREKGSGYHRTLC
jgi:hypothetical protein